MLFLIKPLTKPEKEKAAEHFHCQYSPSPFNFLKKVLSVLLVVTKSLRCFRKLFKKIALFVKNVNQLFQKLQWPISLGQIEWHLMLL